MPGKYRDLTDEVFEDWTVVRRDVNNGAHLRWLCRCVCGVERVVIGNNLRRGRSTDCGCRRGVVYHGFGKSLFYSRWRAMMARCYNPAATGYCRYGGRGIYVVDRWHSFPNFLADMGLPPDGMQLERRENDGPYSPDNCYWATRAQQARNKQTTLRVTIAGRTLCLKDWAQEYGVPYDLVHTRVQKGEPVEEALRRPSRRAPSRRLITFGGKTQSVREWARETGIAYPTLAARLRRGCPIEEALVPL